MNWTPHTIYEHHWYGVRHPEGWHLFVDTWQKGFNGNFETGGDFKTHDVFYTLPPNWVLVATTGP